MIEDTATDFLRKYPEVVRDGIAKEIVQLLLRTEGILEGAVPVDSGNMRSSVMSTVVYKNPGSVAGQVMFHKDNYKNKSNDFYPPFLEYGTDDIEPMEFVKETSKDVRSEFNKSMKGVAKSSIKRARRKARTKRV